MIVQSHPVFDHSMVQSFLMAFEHSAFSMVITDAHPGPDGHQFLFVNQNFLRQTGYEMHELANRSPRLLQGEKTDFKQLQLLKKLIHRGDTYHGQAVNYRKDGSEYVVRFSVNPLMNEQGEIIAFASCQMEVTQEFNDHQLAQMLSEAINQTADAALITDLRGEILYCNQSFTHLTGYTLAEIKGQNASVFKSGKMDKSFYAEIWEKLAKNESFEGVFLNRHKQGHYFFEQKTISPILDEQQRPMCYLALSRDTSDLVHKADHLEYQAYHDPLTGLYNRAKLDEIVHHKLHCFEAHDRVFSMILADIDNFKPINDQYGHDVGDEVLKATAIQLVRSLRREDIVVRWGGEEFCIVIETDLKSAQRVAEQLKVRMSQLDVSEWLPYPITLSFGVSMVRAGDGVKSIFERADQALYRAKENGKNQVQLEN